MGFSDRLAAGRQVADTPLYAEPLTELLAEAVADGWQPAGHRTQWSVRVERGFRCAVITQTQSGTQVRAGLSTWGGLAVLAGVLVLISTVVVTALVAQVYG